MGRSAGPRRPLAARIRWVGWLGLVFLLGCGPAAKALLKVGAKGGAKTAVQAGGAKAAVKVGAAAAGAEAVGGAAVRVERAAVAEGVGLAGDDAARAAAAAASDDGARAVGLVGDDGARAAKSEGVAGDVAETAVDVAVEAAGEDSD